MKEHKKLYEEALVREIMVSTALCVNEFVNNFSIVNENIICQFLDENYKKIIDDTLNNDVEDGLNIDDWEGEEN